MSICLWLKDGIRLLPTEGHRDPDFSAVIYDLCGWLKEHTISVRRKEE